MHKTQMNTSGLLLAIAGIIFFSSKAVLVKLAYQFDVSPTHLLLFRLFFAFPIYLLIALTVKPKAGVDVRTKDYVWLMVFGIIGFYLAALFDFIGLQYIKASLERIILFIYPTLVVLISRIFLKTKITNAQILAIVITYLGIVVTFWGDVDSGSANLLFGVGMIILCAFSYATYLVGSGYLIPKFGAWQFTAYAMMVSTLGIGLQYLLIDGGALWNYTWQVYAYGIAMAVFATLIPSFLVSVAIEKIGANNFSILGSLGPISTIILAFVFLDERLTWMQVVGTVIVLVGIWVVSREKK